MPRKTNKAKGEDFIFGDKNPPQQHFGQAEAPQGMMSKGSQGQK